MESHGQKNKNYFRAIFISLISVVVLWLLSCAGTGAMGKPDIPPLSEAPNADFYAQKWENYGAYYDVDEVVLTSSFTMESCVSIIDITKKIRILTTAGAQYGTIPIYRFAPRVSVFEPHLFDSNGVEIPLDKERLREIYLKSGKVVFPNVTKGALVSLEIRFIFDNTYYNCFTNWFSYTIPVRVGRFVHKTTSNCLYDYRTYGNRSQFAAETYKKGNAKVWTLNDLEPRKDLAYVDYTSITEPKVIARLLKVYSWDAEINSKKEVFKKYKAETEGIKLNLSGDDIGKAVKNCISSSDDQIDKAKKILRWVQDNMTSIGEEHDFRSNIFESEKGSDMQIACLCNKMFKNAGIESDIVITSDKNIHVFDTSFFVHNNYLNMALPVVKINNKSYVAYPYKRGYGLGEYPMSLHNELCMNLKEKSIEPLPDPLWSEKWVCIRRTLDLGSVPGRYTLQYEYKQSSASEKRSEFLYYDKNKQKEELEEWVKEYKQSNTIKTFSVDNLTEYEKPLLISILFENDDVPIPYGNKKIFQLSSFFKDYFKDITPDRTEDVVINNGFTTVDELEVMKIRGRKLSIAIKQTGSDENTVEEIFTAVQEKNKHTDAYVKYKEILSRLYEVNYLRKETDTSYIFQRVIKVAPNRILKPEMKKVYDDCVKLNSIKNSSVVIE